MEAVLKLKSVLCDPEGMACIQGSAADRAIIDSALSEIEAENAALAGTKLYPRPDPRVVELEGIIRHASQVKTLDDNLIAELETQIAKLTRQRDEAVQMLADWCDAVRDNGTGWDDWDEHYKDAAWRQCGIRELIDAART